MSFNNYPYTDFHEMNMDWILEQMKNLIEQFGTISAAWEEFKSEFSDNLSDAVKAEIDTMYHDGRLAQLIASISTNEVNAVAIGCDSTGLSDCSEIIQQALNNGNSIYFPKGIYNITSVSLPIGTHLRGVEAGANLGSGAYLKIEANNALKLNGYTAIYTLGVYGNDLYNGVTIPNDAVGASAKVDGCVIRNCKNGIHFESSTNSLDSIVTNTRIAGCTESGINNGTWGLEVSNVTASDCILSGLNITKSGIYNNIKIWKCGVGFDITGLNNNITNIQIDGCNDSCIHIADNATSNYINGKVYLSSTYGIICEGPGNTIDVVFRNHYTNYSVVKNGGLYLKGELAYANNIKIDIEYDSVLATTLFNTLDQDINFMLKYDYPVPNSLIINGSAIDITNSHPLVIYAQGSVSVSQSGNKYTVTGTLVNSSTRFKDTPALSNWPYGFTAVNSNTANTFKKAIVRIKAEYYSQYYAVAGYVTGGTQAPSTNVNVDYSDTKIRSNANNVSLPGMAGTYRYIYVSFEQPVNRINMSNRFVQNVPLNTDINCSVEGDVFILE